MRGCEEEERRGKCEGIRVGCGYTSTLFRCAHLFLLFLFLEVFLFSREDGGKGGG